ncbi:Uncharacterised protein [Mycobacteroides abscessus subsp. massiliense]|uniref:Uncharacterized protein n=1 Tax=Mycobacteroides abscessus subsp. massiliense TaxID=1962118 RepID=A0A1U0YS82_9MYCO|nr:hypothetical protein [Mycobacteroides abscessus]SIN46726.1 Uncharacterised protein [Mycobacteroides abscessus subsp. bolletii]SKF10290.1 Uncharacterised protein [Mycobacteroides abscessus subsp. massiliense]MBE5431360.1 hypothetical protein [Mycobacteroides abscessus]MBE5443839.1 hypothetical protein [Mycobacteroides abscessus]
MCRYAVRSSLGGRLPSVESYEFSVASPTPQGLIHTKYLGRFEVMDSGVLKIVTKDNRVVEYLSSIGWLWVGRT